MLVIALACDLLGSDLASVLPFVVSDNFQQMLQIWKIIFLILMRLSPVKYRNGSHKTLQSKNKPDASKLLVP